MNPMNIFTHYSELITEIVKQLEKEGEIVRMYVSEVVSTEKQLQREMERGHHEITKPVPKADIEEGILPAYCEPPRNASHGELSTNYAFIMSPRLAPAPEMKTDYALDLSRLVAMDPLELAEMLKPQIEKLDGIGKVEVSLTGFINMTLEPRMWQERITDILETKEKWGDNNIGEKQRINVEYVSANPTGPLHAAHARGGIIGDSLANLIEKSGYKITREYYVNDAGNQVDILAQSVYTRYLQILGDKSVKVDKDKYSGEYVKETAQNLLDAHGDSLGEGDIAIIRDFAIKDMMRGIKEDLTRLNIHIDRFSSERELVKDGLVDKAIDALTEAGHIYQGIPEKPKSDKAEDWEPREQMLFRSTKFGDDVDRTLQKSDGSWTYFATDIAYHLDKLNRGSDTLINIWGADHGGYVKRMKSAVAALSGGADNLNVQLVQLVKLMDKGKPVKMSKRAGTFVALSDVLDAVGADILRFIMLTRRGDQAMDFDYAEVTQQTRDNPVFYVQYAHARAHSVLNQKPGKRDAKNLARLTDDGEMQLIRHLASFPRQVEAAAENLEPHRIAFYLIELAGLFHALWNRGREDANLRFLGVEADLEDARLQLVEATAIVLQNGLGILGVSAPKEM